MLLTLSMEQPHQACVLAQHFLLTGLGRDAVSVLTDVSARGGTYCTNSGKGMNGSRDGRDWDYEVGEWW